MGPHDLALGYRFLTLELAVGAHPFPPAYLRSGPGLPEAIRTHPSLLGVPFASLRFKNPGDNQGTIKPQRRDERREEKGEQIKLSSLARPLTKSA